MVFDVLRGYRKRKSGIFPDGGSSSAVIANRKAGPPRGQKTNAVEIPIKRDRSRMPGEFASPIQPAMEVLATVFGGLKA